MYSFAYFIVLFFLICSKFSLVLFVTMVRWSDGAVAFVVVLYYLLAAANGEETVGELVT